MLMHRVFLHFNYNENTFRRPTHFVNIRFIRSKIVCALILNDNVSHNLLTIRSIKLIKYFLSGIFELLSL